MSASPATAVARTNQGLLAASAASVTSVLTTVSVTANALTRLAGAADHLSAAAEVKAYYFTKRVKDSAKDTDFYHREVAELRTLERLATLQKEIAGKCADKEYLALYEAAQAKLDAHRSKNP